MPSESARARIVLSTLPDVARATALSHALVARRLVACVNVIGGVTSVYRWRGVVEESQEALLVMKTDERRIAELEQVLRELHPYDVPEFVVLAAEHVEAQYARWLIEETAPDAGA